jgi:hypothetical protein
MSKLRGTTWAALIVTAALAPNALAAGVYFGGGLGAHGQVEITTPDVVTSSDMGATWAAGGGFGIPVWVRSGAVRISLEMATDVNFTMIDKALEGQVLAFVNLRTKTIPIRESLVFAVGVGPSAAIKPYIGFGGGPSIVMWEAYYDIPGYPELEIDSATDVKPTFSIPFGCDFRLGSNVSLGPRAEYVIITGEVDGINPYEEYEAFEATVPNIFFFGGQARFDF